MRAADGVGVDVHASWRCVTPFGTLVEVGKRDITGHVQLHMHPFLENRTCACPDVRDMAEAHPAYLHRKVGRRPPHFGRNPY